MFFKRSTIICSFLFLFAGFSSINCSCSDQASTRKKNSCKADEKEEWSYAGVNGPDHWVQIGFPGCGGSRQSPINIDASNVKIDKNLPAISFKNYDIPIKNVKVTNTGRSVLLEFNDGVKRLIKVEGEDFQLMSMHFHFSGPDKCGSEHLIHGKRFTMEGHILHDNIRNETAVIAILFQIKARDLSAHFGEFNEITQCLKRILYRNDSTVLRSKLKLSALVPQSDYYRYDGSLSTPPCTEGIKWFVMKAPVSIAKKQWRRFHQLYSTTKKDFETTCFLYDNYRDVQKQNGRIVYSKTR